MKKTVIFGLIWIGLLSLVGCWTSMTVVEYNDAFIAAVNKCLEPTQSLWTEFENWSTDLSSLQWDIELCKTASDDASDLWNFDWDASLKDAVVGFLDTYVDYLEKFADTNPYWDVEEISIDDEENYKSLIKELSEIEWNLNSQMTVLQETQEAFAAKHWLKLQ